MKNFLFIMTITAIILCTCFNAPLITEGCRSGLSLWYSAIIPVLLPFMLIAGVIINTLNTDGLRRTSAYTITLIIGLMCGFPTGTIAASYFYNNGLLQKTDAQTILPLCNNVSPMFLYGYIYSSYLKYSITLPALLLCIYAPQLIFTAAVLILRHVLQTTDNISDNAATALSEASAGLSHSYHSIITGSIHNITVIGVYMVIFSIASQFILHYIPGEIPVIFTAFLEISNGVPMIQSLNIPIHAKTVLTISLTSFGGVSAIFQSMEMIHESGLSFSKYITGKLLCGISCASFALFYLGR